MVCLNTYLPFNKYKLKNNIFNGLQDMMIKLEFDLNLDKIKVEKINKNIKEEINKMFNNDYFLYLTLDDEYCTHKFKKGRNEGYLCTKKINTNLNGEKKDYLCTKHSKKHVKRKRLYKNIDLKLNENINKKQKIIKDVIPLGKIKNKHRNSKKRKIKRIFICNGGFIDFKKIFNNIL